jgi:hypothetical protein
MLDHGILNVPLAKRGDINAELDAYKRHQAAAAAAKRKADTVAHREQKAEAKAALAEMVAVPGLLEKKAAALGCDICVLIAELSAWSKWTPARVLKAKAEWMPIGAQP